MRKAHLLFEGEREGDQEIVPKVSLVEGGLLLGWALVPIRGRRVRVLAHRHLHNEHTQHFQASHPLVCSFPL